MPLSTTYIRRRVPVQLTGGDWLSGMGRWADGWGDGTRYEYEGTTRLIG